jgi:hypothetical protein
MLSKEDRKVKLTQLTQEQRDEIAFLSSELKTLTDTELISWELIKKLDGLADQLSMFRKDVTSTYVSLLKQGYEDLDLT